MGQSESLEHRGCSNTNGDKFRKYMRYNTVNGDSTLIGLSCTECLSEWVAADHVIAEHRGSEDVDIDGKTFHLVNKPDVDVSTDTTEIKDMKNLAGHVTAGDHIKYRWFEGPFHHAIVKDVERMTSGCDQIALIHRHGEEPGGGTESSAMVIKEVIEDMRSKASIMYRCDYSNSSVCADDRVLTLARAVAWVGEKLYNFTDKSCEHFAVFCKTGRHRGAQGEMGKRTVVRCTIRYEDERVENITDLSVGDHIVMYMTVIHPRCHMIVTSVDHANGKFGVIRFTYEKGVVEEELDFRKPIHKVTSGSTFSPEETIERARKPIEEEYNILSFNCKHFAFWCKTGKIPSSP